MVKSTSCWYSSPKKMGMSNPVVILYFSIFLGLQYYTYIHTHIHTYIHIHTHTYIYIYISIDITQTHTHIYIYVYVNMYIYILSYIPSNIPSPRFSLTASLPVNWAPRRRAPYRPSRPRGGFASVPQRHSPWSRSPAPPTAVPGENAETPRNAMGNDRKFPREMTISYHIMTFSEDVFRIPWFFPKFPCTFPWLSPMTFPPRCRFVGPGPFGCRRRREACPRSPLSRPHDAMGTATWDLLSGKHTKSYWKWPWK